MTDHGPDNNEEKAPYPEAISDTTQGHPHEPAIEETLVMSERNHGKESYPEELLSNDRGKS